MMKQEHRTNAYVFTADVLCADSMQQINAVQRTVRAINAQNKLTGNPKRFRVSLKGRLGKNNPNAVKYRRVKGWATGYYTGNTYQTIRLADAATVDVYIHAR